MNPERMIRTALWLLPTLTIAASADQQVIYPPSNMPRVDMHTHMDTKTQHAKCVATMDQYWNTDELSALEASGKFKPAK